ncbi:MAG TPA: c-type cytochrome [Rhodocyclaceae bacterium]|nr:c-type cytochrome [Rhodocyclaceae bacterium]
MKNIRFAVLLAATCIGTTAFASEALMQKAGCVACHAKDKKMMGPSFKDIAAKYQSDQNAPAILAAKVRKGGSGVWGPIPMPPNGPEKISDADLKSLVEWILKGAK